MPPSAGGSRTAATSSKCITHDLWQSLNEHIFEYLRSVTLAQLVAKQHAEGQDGQVMELKDQRPARRERPENAVA